MDAAVRRGKRPAEGDPVVMRALSLLAAFDSDHRTHSLADLSRRAGMPLSTTFRLAGHLLAWGALEKDDDDRYVVGLRLFEVASLAPRIPPTERADAFAVIYLLAYLAFGVPAVAAGALVGVIGLGAVCTGYGVIVILLAVLAFVLRVRRRG